MAPSQVYGLNDTIGCLLDCEAGVIAFAKNGKPLGPAFQLPQVRSRHTGCPLARGERLACLWPGYACQRFVGRSSLSTAPCALLQIVPPGWTAWPSVQLESSTCGKPKSAPAFPCLLTSQYLQGQALYPAICLKNAELAVNFGAAPFRHPPPPGYVGLAAAPRAHTASWQDAPAGGGGGDRKPLAIILEPARCGRGRHQCHP